MVGCGVTSTTDWDDWHRPYEDPDSALSQRLRVVQRHIAEHLDATAPAAVTVLSSCAGDGRDLLEVLGRRPDAHRVTATLLEADPRNVARATEHASRLGLAGVEVRCVDAGVADAYDGAVPADLVLLCGIFGNVPDEDVRRTVAAARGLCRPGARVIWTRHRRAPDLTPRVRDWFAEHGFALEHFVAPAQEAYSVGVHRFDGTTARLQPGERLFTFTR